MIPLSIPNLGQVEQERVAQAIAEGWVSTAGPDVTAFEKRIAEYCGARFAIAVNSGSAALFLALKALDAGPDDLVLAPNLTFVAAVNAIRHTGATPVLVDADPDTLQMDPGLVEAFVREETELRGGTRIHKATGKRLRTVLPVHVLGYCGDLPRLRDFCGDHGLQMIEDAAEAMGTRIADRHAGTFGLIGCLSFNGNKVMTTGGGGMLLTNDPRLADRARHLSTQAKSFSAEYIHDEAGYNLRMPSLNAALGLAQLDRLEAFLARKRAIHARYAAALRDVPGLRLADAPAPTQAPNHWMPTIFHPAARQLGEALHTQGIQTRKLWLPMNRLPMYRDCLYLSREDHSYTLYEHSLSLPCSTGLTGTEQATVIEAVRKFLCR